MNWYLICTAVAAASAIAMAWFCGRARSAAAAAKFTAAEMRGERNDWKLEAERLQKLTGLPRVGDYRVTVYQHRSGWFYRIDLFRPFRYSGLTLGHPGKGPEPESQESSGPYASQREAIKEGHRRVGKMRARHHIYVADRNIANVTTTEAPA